MITFLPKLISRKAIAFYFVTLAVVSVVFTSHILPLLWVLFGAVEVCAFFYFSNLLTKQWHLLHPRVFVRKLFWTSLGIRLGYMVFVYFFYDIMTGRPFMFHAADELMYYDMSKIWSERGFAVFSHEMSDFGLSDSGEIYWAALLCRLMGPYILPVRIGHCFASAATCVLIYRLSQRHFGEGIGRMSAIFCMLMPNLIYYCGVHLKEADMVFLTVLFVYSVDHLFYDSKFDVKYLVLALVTLFAFFTFRTVLGIVGVIATIVAVVFVRGRLDSWWKRIVMILAVVIALSATAIDDRIMREVGDIWEGKDFNQRIGMLWRSERAEGNVFSKYMSQTVFAPLIFTIPFPTMVDTPNQENQQMLNGGNYVKNVMSGFVVFCLIMLIVKGDWRKHILPLAMMGGYLLVISFSNFAHSERFHQPAIPFELMFAAVGISMLKKKHLKWIDYWLYIILIANVLWAWFKLAGRGMM